MDNRYVQQFKKGSLEMILLCLIGRKETYGYEIITELNNSASVLGYAKEGTIYPILYRLQEAELIQCRLAPAAANGGSKKYYSLTHKGSPNLSFSAWVIVPPSRFSILPVSVFNLFVKTVITRLWNSLQSILIQVAS